MTPCHFNMMHFWPCLYRCCAYSFLSTESSISCSHLQTGCVLFFLLGVPNQDQPGYLARCEKPSSYNTYHHHWECLQLLEGAALCIDRYRTLTLTAMDTTSTVLPCILNILAVHHEVQDRLWKKILDTLEKNGGQDFSYDKLVLLPLLDTVCL